VGGGVQYAHIVTQPVSVPDPCDCKPNQLVPVAAIVANYETNNDNALINLNPAVFSGAGGNAQRLDLPCGYYYLDAIQNSQPLAIVAHGHTALFVGGDISAQNPLSITLDPTATLDLFVAGTIATSDAFSLGSPNYPALMRTYVGGSQTITFSSGANISGNFYAAAAPLNWESAATVYGAVYAGDFSDMDSASIHYDRAVLQQGSTCPPPAPPDGGTTTTPDGGTTTTPDGGTTTTPDGGTTTTPDGGGGQPTPMCGSCKDCGNQACINGQCGACTSNSQCCAPLVCDHGTCVIVIG
jgi:hypothetical protein